MWLRVLTPQGRYKSEARANPFNSHVLPAVPAADIVHNTVKRLRQGQPAATTSTSAATLAPLPTATFLQTGAGRKAAGDLGWLTHSLEIVVESTTHSRLECNS